MEMQRLELQKVTSATLCVSAFQQVRADAHNSPASSVHLPQTAPLVGAIT
jgi:hypothetical protein